MATDALDCQRCGACCAAFRVSFYWAEAELAGLPPPLVEQVTPWLACMAGTHAAEPHCAALSGTLGERVACTVYEQRPSPCREVEAGDAKCLKARRLRGIDAEPTFSARRAVPPPSCRKPA